MVSSTNISIHFKQLKALRCKHTTNKKNIEFCMLSNLESIQSCRIQLRTVCGKHKGNVTSGTIEFDIYANELQERRKKNTIGNEAPTISLLKYQMK